MNSVQIAQTGCGALFLAGLLTGLWKFRAMSASEEGVAPLYIDICHRTALLYSFASLVLAEFAKASAWPEWLDSTAVAVPLFFFCSSVLIYAIHGYLNDTDNQFRRPYRVGPRHIHGSAVHGFMYLLTVGEVGGFLVLFAGFVRSMI